MEKLIVFMCFWGLIFTGFDCKDQETSKFQLNSELDSLVMVIIDVYKESPDQGLSLVYLVDPSTVLIKPNGFESLGLGEIPLPPPEQVDSYFNKENKSKKQIKSELLFFEKGVAKKMDSLIQSFEIIDFEDVINYGKFDDGIGLKINIIFSDKNIMEFSLVNGATANQRAFLKYYFDQVIKNSKINREQLIFFLR